MKKKPTYYKEVITILQELHDTYPTYSLGRHISTALGDYPDTWDLTDKEVLYAFEKYRATLSMDVPRETDANELERILKDGMNLTLDEE